MSQIITQIGIDILTGLIITAILSISSFMYLLYRTLKKQSSDIKLMKKATAFVLRRLVHETLTLHPGNKDEIEDLEKTYNDLAENDD